MERDKLPESRFGVQVEPKATIGGLVRPLAPPSAARRAGRVSI